MFIYVVLEALAGIIAGIILTKRTKKSEDIIYGKLDKAGRITNVILAIVYAITSPFYLLLGMLSDPDGEGLLIILGIIVSLIAASASLICSMGLAFSVVLRRKGRSGLSFAVQFAGIVGIALTVLLHGVFAGSLISSLN